MRSCVVLIVLLAHLFLPSDLVLAQEPNGKSNRVLRQKAFEFLFDEFISDKKCVWEEFGEQLREVVIYERKRQATVLRSPKQSLHLSDGSHLVAGFFDRIAIKGARLNEIKNIRLKVGKKIFQAKAVMDGDKLTFKIPALPIPVYSVKSKMFLIVEGGAEIDNISLVANQPLFNSYESYAKSTSVFVGSGDRSFEAQKAFIEKIKDMEFEELAKSLQDDSNEFSRIIAPAQMTASIDIISVNGVLADRRISKMYEVLIRMESNEAEQLISQNFESELSKFIKDWQNSKILPARQRYGIEALLYLSSEFSSSNAFLAQVDSWRAWYDKNKARKGFQFKKQGGPDFLLLANLYANVVIGQKNLSPLEANDWLSEKLGPAISETSPTPKLETRWLPSSDWTPSRVDLLTDIPTFQSFRSMRNIRTQEQVLSILRSEISWDR